MISFIIIGRNEGWKITSCIESVFNAIKNNQYIDYEVIYVDSKSTDDSIERANQFEQLTIIQLTGECNAAIARNVGAEYSKGNILFFIDGDMEIKPEFLSKIYLEEEGLVYPYISGQLKNFNYNEKGEFINNTWQYKGVLTKENYFPTTGGVFIINKSLWDELGGMNISFKMGEDLDFGLRLAKRGIKILRKKEIIAYHHTVSYTHKSRMWRIIFSGDIAYANSFLLRKHFLNYYAYNKLIKNYYTLASLLLALTLFFLFKTPYALLLYALVLGLKSFKSGNKNIVRLAELFVYYIIRDLAFIFYLFIPIGKINTSDIRYIKVQ